ncbi:acyl-CoA thioesterase, partial [Streptomyces sp. MCAF7]
MTIQASDPESDIPGKPTSAARITLSHIMTGSDTNLLGTVHGGVIMKLVDDAAGAVAGRHSEGPAVTASMDEMAFLEPVRVGDLVHVKAQVNWTGRSSMEIGVRVMAERWNEST